MTQAKQPHERSYLGRSSKRDAALLEIRTASSMLFEVAWEVCTQVGGIYTVLRSKAPATVRRWRDSYYLMGPYREASAKVELEPHPPGGPIKAALEEVGRHGIRMHFGRWLVTGRPQVLLVDLASVAHKLGEIKYHLWKDNGISCPDHEYEFDECCAFGYAVAEFLTALRPLISGRPILAHFHEWQGAAAVPMLKHRQTPIATVFTTHATLVGRNISAANVDLYEHLGSIDGAAVAYQHGFAHRHALEGAAAQSADVFTTVSGITALEARQFLGRNADVLLPNGLNIERFSAPHEFQILHRQYRDRIHEFVMGHFFPSYTFDLDNTYYIFTSGRYEYRNKGLDVFIEALHELNQRMKAESSPATVIAFIVTRARYHALNVETLNRQAMFNELRDTCETITSEIGRKLFRTVARGKMPTIDDLLDEYATLRLKRMMYALHQGPLPTIITHDLIDQDNDPVLRHLRHRGLWNLPDDRVKIVFHPEFMTATSPLLGLEYDQFVRGCHLGVFPSYYEPWGYTPLECIVRGVPAITSDLSGFGTFAMENLPRHEESGIYVARRNGAPTGTAVGQIVNWVHALTRTTRRERIALRNKTEGHAEYFDWTRLIGNYNAAYRLAFAKLHPSHKPTPAGDTQATKETTAPPTKPKRATRKRAARGDKRGDKK